jgi:carboxyl-terminal processing protease
MLNFVVTRDKIPVHTVDAVYMIRPGVGYIRIGSFGAKTYREFMECVNRLQDEGMERLVVDLQDNGGGYLQTAVDIANGFLGRGDTIVYTKGRRTRDASYQADGRGALCDIPVVVLINEFSASASEILTGAIQDHDRGIVVDRSSLGKGLVQRPIDLPDGSMIRLTVAHYYTPSGRCIQKPYEKGQSEDYAQDLEKRLKHGELTNRDSIHFADSLRYYTLKKHRVVYGGGGIMPDEFVALDTLRYTKFHRQLAAKSIVVNQNLKYIDNNRKQLQKKYKTFEEYNQKFEVPQTLLDAIVEEGKKQKVEPKDEEELARTVSLLRIQLKALIARDLWEMKEYYQVMNESSDIVRRGLEMF